MTTERVLTEVVLVHGFASSFESNWERTGFAARLVATGRTVIPFDFPGHGTAPKPYDVESYADLATDLLAALPTGRVVDAVGFSVGAATLLRLVARRAELFGRVVLAGIGDSVFNERGPSEQLERLVDALEHGVPVEDDERAREFQRLATQDGNDPRALAAFIQRPDPVMTEEELGRAVCPTLVVLGEHDFCGPADRLVRALPDARLVVVPDAYHFDTVRSTVFQDATMAFLTDPG